MIKMLLGLTMVLGISVSCTKKNKDEKVVNTKTTTVFFKNDTIQNILDGILSENNDTKSMNIELLDNEKYTLLIFNIMDSIFDCNHFEGIRYYDKKRMMFINSSNKINFKNIIDLNKLSSLDSCDKYIMRNQNIVIDPEQYVYKIDEEGKVHYPNGKDIIYSNGKIKLKLWRENKRKAQDTFGKVPDVSL